MGDSRKPAIFELSRTEEYESLTLIIGGGIAGLTCAEKLSKEKIPSIVIEKEETLGGQLKRVSSFYHTEVKPWELINEKLSSVKNTSLVKIFKETTVKNITGLAGNFFAEIEGPKGKENIRAGSIVFASGNDSIKREKSNRAITLMQLEELMEQLKKESTKKTIAIVIEEDDFLIGPGVALKHAHILKEAGHDVYYFYEQIKVNEEYLEALYRECKEKGVVFVRNAKENIELQESDGKMNIKYKDSFNSSDLNDVSLECDMLVTNESFFLGEETKTLAKKMKVNRCQASGFLQEDNYHLLPVGTNKLGVYAIGACRKPGFLWNVISEAEAAAENIFRTLSTYREWVKERPVIIGPSACVLCLTCLRTCPRHAVYIDPKGGQCKIHRLACEGCGICVSECPNFAIEYPEGLNLRERIGPEGRGCL